MHRLIGRAALGLFAALALAMASCGGDTEDPTGPDTGPPDGDAALALASSANHLQDEPFAFESTLGSVLSMSGAMDPADRIGSLTMSITNQGTTLDMDVVIAEPDIWLNLGEMGAALGTETPWMHMDTAQLPEGFLGAGSAGGDLNGVAELLEGLGPVTQVDEHTFEGEIDVTVGESAVFDQQTLDMLGEEATSLPFTATVDDQGRLTNLTIDMPQVPELPPGTDTLEIRYFDFGTEVAATPPPDDQVSEMPEELYQMFSGGA